MQQASIVIYGNKERVRSWSSLPDPGYDERKGVERVMLTYRPSLTEFEDWYLLRLLGFGPTAHGDHNNVC
jgi:hypothetical protein